MNKTINHLLTARSIERMKPQSPDNRITIAAIEVAICWASEAERRTDAQAQAADLARKEVV